MSILIKGIPLGGYEISIMKDGERYRARVDGIWCEVEEIPTTDTDSDTISRKAAIDALRAMQTYKLFAGDDMLLIDQAGAQTELMMLPPAQPEIVRCKDCKYWNSGSCEYPEHAVNCQDYWVGDIETEAEHFCGYAKRREVTA